MASSARDGWRQHRKSHEFFIASPAEPNSTDERRAVAARNCADEGAKAGAKAAAVAFVGTAIPTIISGQKIQWVKRNLNYTAQALIVSAATVATYVIVSDKTILKCARTTSYAKIEADRAAANRNV